MVFKHEFCHHVDQEHAFNDTLKHIEEPDIAFCIPTQSYVLSPTVKILPESCEVSVAERRNDAKGHDDQFEPLVASVRRRDYQVILEASLYLLLSFAGLLTALTFLFHILF